MCKNFNYMIKSNLIRHSLALFLIISVVFQFALAETAPEPVKPLLPASSPAPSVDSSSPVKHNAQDNSQLAISARRELENQKSLAFLNKLNLRGIDRIKWPADPEIEGPSRVKYQELQNIKSLSEKIRAAENNCKLLVAQYENEVFQIHHIKRGTIREFDLVCEMLSISLKQIKSTDDNAFKVVGQFMVNRLDLALFRHIESADFERNKVYSKTLLGIIGMPYKYMGAILQIMIIILAALNGFLFFKISRL